MNALRRDINNILDEEEVDGCVLNIDLLHKKIQTIAVDLLNEDLAIEGGLQAEDQDAQDIRSYITYCPYDYEDEEYLPEYEVSLHIETLGKGFIKKAIIVFLEDIQ